MNLHVIVGIVSSELTLNYTKKGIPVCNFLVSTSKRFISNGKIQEKTDFHRCQVWGKLGESCKQYLSKGREVAIVGESEFQRYIDREGYERYYTNLKVTSCEFLGRNSKNEVQTRQLPASSYSADEVDSELTEQEQQLLSGAN